MTKCHRKLTLYGNNAQHSGIQVNPPLQNLNLTNQFLSIPKELSKTTCTDQYINKRSTAD